MKSLIACVTYLDNKSGCFVFKVEAYSTESAEFILVTFWLYCSSQWQLQITIFQATDEGLDSLFSL